MMTLWSIFRSPLMFGGELRDNDEWTLSLLTNEEVLAAHRHGSNPRMVYREDDRTVWTSDGPNGERYVALFNLRDEASEVSVTLEQLGLSGSVQIRDLWQRADLGSADRVISAELRPHASVFYRLT